MKRPGIIPGLFANDRSPLTQHAADHAADEATGACWIRTAVVMLALRRRLLGL
jgi:hypothetical protein